MNRTHGRIYLGKCCIGFDNDSQVGDYLVSSLRLRLKVAGPLPVREGFG